MFILESTTGTQTSDNLGTTRAQQLANGVPNGIGVASEPPPPFYDIDSLLAGTRRFLGSDQFVYTWSGTTSQIQTNYDSLVAAVKARRDSSFESMVDRWFTITLYRQNIEPVNRIIAYTLDDLRVDPQFTGPRAIDRLPSTFWNEMVNFINSARQLANSRWTSGGLFVDPFVAGTPYKSNFLTDGDFDYATGRTGNYITEFSIPTGFTGITFFKANVGSIKVETLTSGGSIINSYNASIPNQGVDSEIALTSITSATRCRVTMTGHNGAPATCAEVVFGAVENLGTSDPNSFTLSVEPSVELGYRVDVDMKIPRDETQKFRNRVAQLGAGSENRYHLTLNDDDGTAITGHISNYTFKYDPQNATQSDIHLTIVGNN